MFRRKKKEYKNLKFHSLVFIRETSHKIFLFPRLKPSLVIIS